MILPTNLQSAFTAVVIAILFLAIYSNRIRPALAFFLAALIFNLSGIISVDEMVQGIANPSILSIFLLIFISLGLRRNFKLEPLFDRFFKYTSYRPFLFNMMAKAALLSSFINNTPVVTLLTPYIHSWGQKHQIAPSKLLIPLSFAAILGGMITIIGTSTTLVLNGFLLEAGLPPFAYYHFLILGGLVCVVGIGFMYLLGHYLLPNHRKNLVKFEENPREYLVEMKLTDNSTLKGQTVLGGGLRNLQGVYLVEIIRNNETISPVAPYEKLQTGDLLIFAGKTDEIADLITTDFGLELPKSSSVARSKFGNLLETTISFGSSLAGKKVKDSDFRNRYDAVIVAIHRHGQKLSGKIGEVKLQPGDLLLLSAGEDFDEKVQIYRDLFITSQNLTIANQDKKKTRLLWLLAITTTVLLITGVFSLFISLLIIVAIMVFSKLLTLTDFKREMDLNLLSILVFSLALGQAMINSGLGNLVAQTLITWMHPFGLLGLIIGLMLLTTILTSLISNVGAVSIAFPIALALGQDLGIDTMPLFLSIAFAASAAFMTPIGYQTNLIIMGPGGYRFRDFLRVGIPFTCIYLTTVIGGLLWLFPWILD